MLQTNNRPDNQADWLDEVINDCTLALTSYTLGPEKITSYDEIIIDRPKLVAAITTKIAEERLKEVKAFRRVSGDSARAYAIERIRVLEAEIKGDG